jgi:hypothetical protein
MMDLMARKVLKVHKVQPAMMDLMVRKVQKVHKVQPVTTVLLVRMVRKVQKVHKDLSVQMVHKVQQVLASRMNRLDKLARSTLYLAYLLGLKQQLDQDSGSWSVTPTQHLKS